MPTLSMFELWQRRSYNASVDVIVGACRNDYDLLLPPLSDLTWDQLPFAIDNFVANASLAQGLFLYYNTTGRESTAFLTLRRLFDDSLLCSIEYQSHCAARAGVTGAFSYIFDHRPAWLPPAFSGFGAYHTAELPFVFNNAWDVSFSSVPFTEEESKLASSIMSPLWAAFATGGVPVVPEFSWKPWTMEGDGGTAFLSSTPSMRSSVLNDKPCLIWNLVNLFPC
jgi:carboxylesterase type B